MLFTVIMVKVLTWILHPSPEKEIKMYETNIIKAFKYSQNYSLHSVQSIWKSINANYHFTCAQQQIISLLPFDLFDSIQDSLSFQIIVQ